MDFTVFSQILFPFASEVGYIALSLVSFFGSLIPFVPIPSFVLLATMAVGDQFNLHALAILSAVMATIAKQIIFYVSYGGGRIISEKTRKRMKPFERLVKRYGGAATFVAAATPIPDDLVYIPLGLAKYNPKRFFVATLTGKIVLCYIIVLVSHFVGISLLDPLLENIHDASTIYIGMIVFGASLTMVVFLLLRLDWEKILGRFAPWTLEEEEKKD
ncbi:MAG TPA: VTT domain-containing protein [Nitrosopumilaceae archaeon]